VTEPTGTRWGIARHANADLAPGVFATYEAAVEEAAESWDLGPGDSFRLHELRWSAIDGQWVSFAEEIVILSPF